MSDGYWLMLSPPAPGAHTIVVHVENPSFGISFVLIYNITVPGRGTASAAQLSTGEPEAGAMSAAPAAQRTSWGRLKAYYH